MAETMWEDQQLGRLELNCKEKKRKNYAGSENHSPH